MGILRKVLVWAALAAAAGIILVFALPSYSQGEASIAGKTAEDFAFELAGKPSHLSDMKGKVVVLNFWGSWCGPCVEEMPSLVQLQQRFKDKGLTVVGISIDVDGDAYHKFLKDYKIDFPTVRDPDQKTSSLYGSFKWPETYIIDRNGVVRRKFIGAVEWSQPEIVDFLNKL